MKIIDFIITIFNKKQRAQLLSPPKTRYQELVESIDDLELCKMFINEVTPEIKQIERKYGDVAPNYPLQTKISENDTIEIVQKFFASIDEKIFKKVNDVITGQNSKIKLEFDQDIERGANVSGCDKYTFVVHVPIFGDLRQLYDMVHELTHILDIDNGDTETRKVLGEIAPQCMERLLDDFLLKMSDEEMQKYGFDKAIIEKDIQRRRIMTFLTRYHNAITLDKGLGNRIYNSRYMLAQIYSSYFNTFDRNKKTNRIQSFIECIGNDDFEMANETFGIQISRNNRMKRMFYIKNTIAEANSLITKKIKGTNEKQIITGIEHSDIIRE